MEILMYLITRIFSEATFLIGIFVCIGLLLQKKSFDKVISGTVKTMLGFTIINTAAQNLGMALAPLQLMLQKIFGMPIVPMDIGGAIGASLANIGLPMALIFIGGFAINLLMARFTPFKYIHLSAHVSFFYAGMIAAILTTMTSWDTTVVVSVGSVILGVYLTLTCAYMAPITQKVPGGEGFTIAHSSSIGCWIASKLGGIVGNPKNNLEEIKLPKKLSFLREMSIALTVIMGLLFLVAALLAGNAFVLEKVSGGRDLLSFSILNGITFGVWITIIVTGVRMMLAEIVPAFHGISEKLVPNAKAGLDVPILFPAHPTSVIVGFLSCLTANILGMVILGLVKFPVVVFPALIPVFFTGAVTAIYGNSTGGRRGAIIGSFVNGLILIFGQAFLIQYIGGFEPVMRVLCETDYAFYGPILGLLFGYFG
ncbi:MAG: PTS ascorbate transporter subunit IIC [Erysipelotrichaceae bacterium]